MVKNENTTINCAKVCNRCKKKALILNECKCSKKFCIPCRYPEVHECSFDYKEHGAIQITNNNPIIAGEKISKI